MAYIPEAEISRIKSQCDIVTLIQSYGVELKRQGKTWVGRCPWHDDKTPSLVVTPEKGLWHCLGACDVGGSVIDWVMRMDGVCFRDAVAKLQGDSFLAAKKKRGSAPTVDEALAGVPGHGKIEGKVAEKVEVNPKDHYGLVERLAAYYHEQVWSSEKARSYLDSRGLWDEELLRQFQVGFVDRVIKLPGFTAEERKILRGLGFFRESTAHFTGCVVVPLRDAAGNLVQMYGRRAGTTKPPHLYLPGSQRGILNSVGLQGQSPVVLCESVLDALSGWLHGVRNITCSFGINGFTDELKECLMGLCPTEVVVIYDRDNPGQAAAGKRVAELERCGLAARSIDLPQKDLNDFICQHGASSADRLQKLLQGSPVAVVQPEADSEGVDRVRLQYADHQWEIRGLSKVHPSSLRVTLRLRVEDRFYIDVLDLYQAKQRASFVAGAATECSVESEKLKQDLGRLIVRLEELQQAESTKEPVVELSAQEKAEALTWLRSPELMENIVTDMDRLGLVGEESNKLIAYLAATSSKLDAPLAVVIQSTSAAGKTSLMDAVLSLMPPESVCKYSAMTGQSLFYMGENDLQHKILAVVEEEGAERASYALKILQSEKELVIASTGKDPQSGRLVTQEYKVKGPVMIFLTTTAIDLDEELLNRCLILTVNESREQTRRIHAAQRKAQTLEGLLAAKEKEQIVQLHRNAQRLLNPLLVANPYAEELTFSDAATRSRRDHMKYLTMIRAIALLHQYQRKRKVTHLHGEAVEYIEVSRGDIELADNLFADILQRNLDELPPQTRKLYEIIEEMLSSHACSSFSRRMLRAYCQWGDATLKRHLARLMEMEYLYVHKGENGCYLYENMHNWLTPKGNRLTSEGNRLAPGSGADRGWIGGGSPSQSSETPQPQGVYAGSALS